MEMFHNFPTEIEELNAEINGLGRRSAGLPSSSAAKASSD